MLQLALQSNIYIITSYRLEDDETSEISNLLNKLGAAILEHLVNLGPADGKIA
jgi:hypothetical protein